jgi:hypothetical protein
MRTFERLLFVAAPAALHLELIVDHHLVIDPGAARAGHRCGSARPIWLREGGHAGVPAPPKQLPAGQADALIVFDPIAVQVSA